MLGQYLVKSVTIRECLALYVFACNLTHSSRSLVTPLHLPLREPLEYGAIVPETIRVYTDGSTIDSNGGVASITLAPQRIDTKWTEYMAHPQPPQCTQQHSGHWLILLHSEDLKLRKEKRKKFVIKRLVVWSGVSGRQSAEWICRGPCSPGWEAENTKTRLALSLYQQFILLPTIAILKC